MEEEDLYFFVFYDYCADEIFDHVLVFFIHVLDFLKQFEKF